jgi:hypothetical protein
MTTCIRMCHCTSMCRPQYLPLYLPQLIISTPIQAGVGTRFHECQHQDTIHAVRTNFSSGAAVGLQTLVVDSAVITRNLHTPPPFLLSSSAGFVSCAWRCIPPPAVAGAYPLLRRMGVCALLLLHPTHLSSDSKPWCCPCRHSIRRLSAAPRNLYTSRPADNV